MSSPKAQRTPRASIDSLRRENETLRERLEEAEATLRALAAGEVDAVVVGAQEHVLTLEAPDLPYRLAVERIVHPAVTLTSEGRIIYANRRFAEQLGVLQVELAGKPLAAFVSEASRSAFQTLLRDACSDAVGSSVQADVTFEGESGQPLPVRLGANTLQGGALGECVVVTDLTMQRHYEELRRTQEALRASEEQLRAADRRKDEFMATLAHELRNPLLPMRNAVELLAAHGPLTPELEWARGVLDRQVRTMGRLLDDLLDVARIARNTLELRKERIQLAAVLEAALEMSRPLIAAGQHELVYAVPAEPIYLYADPVRLSQVFGNILNNAAKYTEPRGRIEIEVRRDGGEATVTTRDTGIGIRADMLPHIFKIFTQDEQAIDRSQGGLGIGLSLVKGLVDLHGGSVAAKSDGAGRGSEFVVRLPIASA